MKRIAPLLALAGPDSQWTADRHRMLEQRNHSSADARIEKPEAAQQASDLL